MSNFKLEASEVASYARGRWDNIYASLAPKLGEAIAKKGRHVPCPVHGGIDGFRLHKNSDSGAGICNTCDAFVRRGERGFLDGFAILMWVNGTAFPDTLREVAQIVAPHLLDDRAFRKARPPAPVYTPPPRTEKDVQDDLALVNRMRETWQSAVPLTDDGARLAWRYLESRGLPDPRQAAGIWDDLRFAPSLYYREWDRATDKAVQDHYPAIVALLRNRAGKVCGLHRIYLARDGWGKAPVGEAKKLMGKPEMVSLHDCAIRMGSPGKVVAVAEGPETAMAVRAFTGFSAVWSAVNSTLLRQFRPPEGVVAVHIFGDLDRSGEGQSAMHDLSETLKGLGYQVRADLPPGPIAIGSKGVDWLDVYNQHGAGAIQCVASLREALAQRKVVPISQAARRA